MTKRIEAPDAAMDGLSKSGVSRRLVLMGTAAAGVGAVCMGTAAARAQAKMSQADAKYQTSPKGADKCGGCALFQAPEACGAVEGKISPEGWCELYSAKG